MAALTAQRRMENLIAGLLLPFDHPAKAGRVFYKGASGAIDATGYLVPAAGTAGLRAAGVIDTGHAASVDTTGQSDGDTLLKVQAGIWPFRNSAGGDAIVQADLYKECFLVDDQTVAKTDGGVARPGAGTIVKFETGKIWVAMGFPFGMASAEQLRGLINSASESVTAPGALSAVVRTTRLSVDASDAFTLPDGFVVGQRKSVRCIAATNVPVGTLTPDSVSGFATLTFDAVGEFGELEWNGTAWEIVFTTATVA